MQDGSGARRSTGRPEPGASPRRCRSWSPRRPRSTASARRPGSRPRSWPDGTITEGVLDGDLYLRGSGDPSFGTAALRRLAEQGRRYRPGDVDGRIYGDESFFDRRRGGSGFGISPYVGPLSALAFNRGSMLPLARGWQSDPARFVADRMRVTLRSEQVDVAHRARAGSAPAGRDHPRDDRVAAARGTGPAHEPCVGQLLRRDAAEGPRCPVGHAPARRQRAPRSRRGSRASRASAPASWTAPACREATRSRPARVGRLLAEGTGRAVVRLLLPLAAAGGQVRHARQTHARHRRRPAAAAPRRARCPASARLAGYCKTRGGKRAAFALLMNGVNVWTARRIQDRIAAELARYTG